MTPAAEVARRLEEARDGLLLVVTGAGISLASGIPTFRGTDPDAVWSNDVLERATRRYFLRDPLGSWTWYAQRFASLEGARPNAAHRALVDLERWQRQRGEFLLITQNIDTLHAQAGSEALVEVHGRADRVRCAQDGCEHGAPAGWLPRERFALEGLRGDDPDPAAVPRCPACGGWVRPHVLWFDELYDGHQAYGWDRVCDAVERAAQVLFVGTSFSVGITDLALRAALRAGLEPLSIDPGPDPRLPLRHVSAKAEELLPEVVALLGAAG